MIAIAKHTRHWWIIVESAKGDRWWTSDPGLPREEVALNNLNWYLTYEVWEKAKKKGGTLSTTKLGWD
jgi:hypothetical protein